MTKKKLYEGLFSYKESNWLCVGKQLRGAVNRGHLIVRYRNNDVCVRNGFPSFDAQAKSTLVIPKEFI